MSRLIAALLLSALIGVGAVAVYAQESGSDNSPTTAAGQTAKQQAKDANEAGDVDQPNANDGQAADTDDGDVAQAANGETDDADEAGDVDQQDSEGDDGGEGDVDQANEGDSDEVGANAANEASGPKDHDTEDSDATPTG